MKRQLHSIKLAIFALALGVGGAAQAQLSGMAAVPAGPFIRGDANDGGGYKDEEPTNQIYVSAFQMDTNLVTLALWQQVYNAALGMGYTFDHAGAAAAGNVPVQSVDWYDAVKWCNARSQIAGLTPCYYADTNLTVVYNNQGDLKLTANNVNWTANGYRLPTEAEWEKAARGGVFRQRFPLGDTISHSQAWYSSPASAPPFDAGPYSIFETAPTSVGRFQPNGYGLFDMAGNVREWCWDWYGTNYYASSPTTNPQGPVSGASRVARGGCWFDEATDLRCAARLYYVPTTAGNVLGFRCVAAMAAGQQAQTIIFNASNNQTNLTFGVGAVTLTATASSGSNVTFAVASGPATVAGNVLTITGAGQVDVTASAAASTNYLAASTNLIFTVSKANSTLTWDASTVFPYYGLPPTSVFVVTGSGGALTYVYAGTGSTTYPATPIPPTSAGTYTVTATVAADANYFGASSDPFPFTISLPSNGIVDFASLTNLIGTNAIDLRDLQAVLGSYSHTNTGIVDAQALTTLLGTNHVNLADLQAVLNNYTHSGTVNLAALTNFLGSDVLDTNGLNLVLKNFRHPGIVDLVTLTNFLGSDLVTVDDLIAFLNNYHPAGNVAVATLTGVLGAATNSVDQAGVNAVLAHYWAGNPPYISNAMNAGATNFVFAVSNFTFTVQVNTNLAGLANWQTIGPAVFQFTDTNAIANQAGFYRIVAPTNQ